MARPKTANETNVRSWTIKEVADLLCVSTRTVERLVAAGDLDASRVGRAVRVRAQSVLGYLEANRLEPTGTD
ncbi:helix-turn-helix domain-containing protein [Lentzea sp. NBRC 102530]|uniref:helix-turn-helix domain-containing protein n=1 Tax=Lentzea sp. NBRC 102530 TaxID=3032201 RepID=UPI0024A4EABD|nr:helix-turn-helix domain-containing protein [Lentzea sp. NBRC 102530]GLY55181.1 hypothetical protein Lesp01_88360 [Lentzea sp. NBRC 102530]